MDPKANTYEKVKRHLENVHRNISIANERERAYLEVNPCKLSADSGTNTV